MYDGNGEEEEEVTILGARMKMAGKKGRWKEVRKGMMKLL